MSICRFGIIGAGSIVTKDCFEPGVYAGSPAYTDTEEAVSWTRVRTVACGSETVYAIDATGSILSCGSAISSPSGTEEEAPLS